MFKKLFDTYKEAGFFGIFKKSIDFLKGNIYFKKFYWHETSLSISIENIVPRVKEKVDFMFDNKDETILWINKNIYNGHPYKNEVFENKIAYENNHFISSLKISGKIVGFIKTGVGEVYIKSFKKVSNLKKNTAIILAAYIVPQFRSLGLSKFMYSEVLKELRKRGFKKVYAQIRSNNIASLKVFAGINTKNIATTWKLKVVRFIIFSRLPQNIFVDLK